MDNPQGSGDMIDNFKTTPQYAYILGVYLGDGWVGNYYGDNRVGLKCIDSDFVLAVYKTFTELQTKNKPCIYFDTAKNNKKHMGRKPMFQVSVADNELNSTLKIDTECKSKIPEYVFQWDLTNKKKFIEGLMDSEGSISERKTARKDRKIIHLSQLYCMSFCNTAPWFEDFISICRSVGLIIGKTGSKIEKSGSVCKYFYIRIKSWVNSGLHFNIKRKQDRVEKYMSHLTTPQRLHVLYA